MKKMIQWVLVATLTCGASVFTACSSNGDLRFTAKTTLSKNGQVTATYGPRQEHFTSDDPEHESSEPYRELYRADGSTYTITAHLKKVE